MSSEKEAAKTEKDGGELSPGEVHFHRNCGEIFGWLRVLLPDGGSLNMKPSFHSERHDTVTYVWTFSARNSTCPIVWTLNAAIFKSGHVSSRQIATVISDYMKRQIEPILDSTLKTES
jgi:hypothetical protein